mmetsp:Transcript_79103/g.255687  ORF Transcript_79103/g.255687 Transcript_79103/m.255687 type:complete len:746 (-) Transcript_79103:113-2350(-)
MAYWQGGASSSADPGHGGGGRAAKALDFGGRLPRTEAAFRSLEAAVVHGLPAVVRTISDEAVANLDAVLAPLVEAATRAHVEGAIRALFAEPDNAVVQEAGGRFIAAAATDGGRPELRRLLEEFGAAAWLEAVVRRHPRSKGVQNQALWALFKLQGRQPLVAVLTDQALGSSPEATTAALWGLFHIGSAENISWPERKELAALAEAARQRFPDDSRLATHALGIIGSMLNVKVADADHAQATAAIAVVISALQTHQGDIALQRAAAQTLVSLVEGNSGAAAMLRHHKDNVIALLDGVMRSHPHKAVFGVAGVLEALAREGLKGPKQQAALLKVLASFTEESDLEAILRLDAIGCVYDAMASSEHANSSGIAALGRIAEFLIEQASQSAPAGSQDSQDPSSDAVLGVHIVKCIGTIVRRLECEIQQRRPDNFVYAEALGALRNVSRRSPALARRIAATTSVTAAVEMAFERDFFDLTFECIRQLIGAVLFFSGLAKLMAMLEKYPEAPIFHEAACRVLVETAEHEDGSNAPGTILEAAAGLSFYATRVLVEMVPQSQRLNPDSLACAAIRLHSHVLGVATAGLEEGVHSLLGALRHYQYKADVATEVCCALVSVYIAKGPGVMPVLSTCRAGDALVDVVRRFPNNSEVLGDAAVALGALYGFKQVLDLLRSSPGNLAVQQAGCRALAELCRMNLCFASEEERKAAEDAARATQAAYPGQERWQLQAQIEVTLGLIANAAVAAQRAP